MHYSTLSNADMNLGMDFRRHHRLLWVKLVKAECELRYVAPRSDRNPLGQSAYQVPNQYLKPSSPPYLNSIDCGLTDYCAKPAGNFI